MQCHRCGVVLTQGDAFCTDCGAQVASSEPRSQSEQAISDDSTAGSESVVDAIRRPENVLRVISGVLLLGGLFLCYYAQNGGVWFIILTPLLTGLLLPLLQVSTWTERVDRWETALSGRRARAKEAEGKFARFFRRPFYACADKIWRVSHSIRNPHVRAAVRIALSLYLVALSLFLLMTAAYVIVAVVVLMLVLALLGWILSLNDKSGGRVTARRTRSWFGDERTEYTDASGRKVAESRETVGIFGDPRVEYFDAQGRKTGQSRQETGIFGEEKTVHYNRDGKTVGVSREETDILGNPRTAHYGSDGKETGESRQAKDLFGNDVIERVDYKRDETGETE